MRQFYLQFSIRIILSLSLVLMWACQPSNQNENAVENTSAPQETANKAVNHLEKGTALQTLLLGPEYRNEALLLQNNPKRDTLLLFLDPQGVGRYPIKRYESVVYNRYDVAASNFCRNGLSTEASLQHLGRLLETLKAYKHIKIIGFSGGARLAFLAATVFSADHSAISVLGLGAGMHNPRYNKPFSFEYWVGCGLADFNYAEIAALPKAENVKKFVFEGGHSWPQADVLYTLLKGDFQAHTFATHQQRKSENEAFAKLQGLLRSGNYHTLNVQLDKLKNNSTQESKRQLAYLEFLVYMESAMAVNSGNEAQFNQLLKLAETINPKNADIALLSAKMAALKGEESAMINSLKRALEYGFYNDYALQEADWFTPYLATAEGAEIMSQLQAP